MAARARRYGRIGRGLLLGGAFLLAASCREPTQIRLNISTNVPCTSRDLWRGVAVYVGERGGDEQREAPLLVTHECDAEGHVGSLVIVPSGAKDALVALRVVAGVSADAELRPEECAARDYVGCIVARRAVRFDENSTLDLEVELTQDCIDRGCDSEHTCLTGGCVGTLQAAANVVPSNDPSVYCGQDGVRCATHGQVCCLHVDVEAETTTGACMDPTTCPVGDIVLNCDDESDCVDLDNELGPAMCMLSYDPGSTDSVARRVTSSQCMGRPHQYGDRNAGLSLCQSRQPCNEGKAKCVASEGDDKSQLPGYFWCRVFINQ
jgi:hypothetical protein